MTDVSHDLYRETQAAKTLRAQLADILTGDDDDVMADMVEGETNLHEAIGNAIELLAGDSAALVGIDDLIEKLKKRRDRFALRIDHTRTALSVALEQAGRKSFEHPVATLTLKAVAPCVNVTDEAAIPSRFWKSPPPKLDKVIREKATKSASRPTWGFSIADRFITVLIILFRRVCRMTPGSASASRMRRATSASVTSYTGVSKPCKSWEAREARSSSGSFAASAAISSNFMSIHCSANPARRTTAFFDRRRPLPVASPCLHRRSDGRSRQTP